MHGQAELLLGAGIQARHVDDGELENRRLQLFALHRGNLSATPRRRSGRWRCAIALYRAALEQDNLAEELYQRLIACHLGRGETAQALNAYRRCRELLSSVLGLRPSARTEARMTGVAGR